MKTIPQLSVFVFSFLFFTSAYALPNGSVMGQVKDPVTKEVVSFATVVFDCQGSQHVFTANENGYYYASNIPSCTYNITVFFMSHKKTYAEVKISDGEVMNLDMELVVNDINALKDSMPLIVVGTRGRRPLLDPVDPENNTIDAGVIKDLPVIGVAGINEQQPGVVAINGEYYSHGARAGGLSFYIDDAPVMGTADIPLSGLDTYRSYTGFLPPKYGDTSGGAIVMETKNFFAQR